MMPILEDLTALSPRRLERRLEKISGEALPCIDVWVAEGNREHGLVVALQVDARGRGDVRDLARVLEIEPQCLVAAAWALLAPVKGHSEWRLLLRVDFERPVRCEFIVRFAVTDHPRDPLRATLPLLLAASQLIVLVDKADEDRAAPWFAAPAARECLVELIAHVGA